MKNKCGFTLIELIAVIAIIAVLATVIIRSINDARIKALETRIVTSMDSFYKTGKSQEIVVGNFNVVCGMNGVATSTELLSLVGSIKTHSDQFVCNSTVSAFAASAQLDDTTHWCVDSSGPQGEVAAALGVGVTVCP